MGPERAAIKARKTARGGFGGVLLSKPAMSLEGGAALTASFGTFAWGPGDVLGSASLKRASSVKVHAERSPRAETVLRIERSPRVRRGGDTASMSALNPTRAAARVGV